MAMRKAMKISYASRGRQLAKSGVERKLKTSAGTIRVLEYGFDDTAVQPLYVDLHGGGFVMMEADDDDVMNVSIQCDIGVKVISIAYPKSPEHHYPVALETVREVVGHYIENARRFAVDPGRIGIGGHSSGGNLAAASCLHAKERGEDLYRFQILDYPILDLATSTWDKPRPPGSISRTNAAMFSACYTGLAHAADPLISPVYATPDQLAGLPPALVILAGRDTFHDEGARYADMLRAAGVQVKLLEFEKEPHGFTYASSPATDEAVDAMEDFILEQVGKRRT